MTFGLSFLLDYLKTLLGFEQLLSTLNECLVAKKNHRSKKNWLGATELTN